MSAITFLASSKPFTLPDEIEHFHHHTVDPQDEFLQLGVRDVREAGWETEVEGLFAMPYVYEIYGAGNKLFLLYLEKYMETGDTLELLHFPNQHDVDYYKRRLLEAPEPVVINVAQFTYQDRFGTYNLHPKKWAEELAHKNYLTEFGVTTIVKY